MNGLQKYPAGELRKGGFKPFIDPAISRLMNYIEETPYRLAGQEEIRNAVEGGYSSLWGIGLNFIGNLLGFRKKYGGSYEPSTDETLVSSDTLKNPKLFYKARGHEWAHSAKAKGIIRLPDGADEEEWANEIGELYALKKLAGKLNWQQIAAQKYSAAFN